MKSQIRGRWRSAVRGRHFLGLLLLAVLLLNPAYGQDRICSTVGSDSDGDGWGWENNRTCLVAPRNFPTCSDAAIDPDGDGWGWENGNSCIMLANSGSSDGDYPVCSSPALDPDGNGWGWENNQTCKAAASAPNSDFPACQRADSDLDGNGWGWENNQTCQATAGAAAGPENSAGLFPFCSSAGADPDGDGFGWENSQTCQVVAGTAASPDNSATLFPLCGSAGVDPDGDGFGWENNQTCQVVAGANAEPDHSHGGHPFCASASADSDGDGWGWENNQTCVVVAGNNPQPDNASAAVSICESTGSDPDADGWRWEHNQSCLAVAAALGPDTDQGSDPDIAANPATTDSPSCQASGSDPDGDGFGWENGQSCIVVNFNPATGGNTRCIAGNLNRNGADGVAIFDLGALWSSERSGNGGSDPGWNSVQNLSARLALPDLGGNRSLEIKLAGSARYLSSAGRDNRDLTYSGQLLRNYSVATLAIARRNGPGLDIRQWPKDSLQLCGDFFQDPDFTAREPVVPAVDLATIGAGVNLPGGEYACAQGWGVSHHTANGVSNSEIVNMLGRWGVKSVRVPMNEHCWLAGLIDLGSDDADNNGLFDYIERNNRNNQRWIDRLIEVSADSQIPSVCNGRDCITQGANYRNSLIDLVRKLNDRGVTVVLDLHWTAARGQQATRLQNLPNRDYSIDFWATVASHSEFRNNSGVVFNLFNEPKGTQSWRLMRDGDGGNTAGMQELADAVRYSANANNTISVGGLDYSGDSGGWLSYAVHDPLGRLWADNHAYPAGSKCREASCWNRNLGPILSHGYGVMFGEAGNSIGVDPQGCEQADFVKRVYGWAQQRGVPALSWSFIAGGVDQVNGSCALQSTNSPGPGSCQIPTVLSRWPGQGIASLASAEVSEKCSYDPTPNNFHDDATWAGCAALAYLHGVDMNRVSDFDPVTNGRWGNCSAQEWYNLSWNE